MKTKQFTILLILSLVFSGFFFQNSQNYGSDTPNLDNGLSEKNISLDSGKTLPDLDKSSLEIGNNKPPNTFDNIETKSDISSSSQIQNSQKPIDTNQWYEGETVRTNVSFTKSIVRPSDYVITSNQPIWNTWSYTPQYNAKDDGFEQLVVCEDTSNPISYGPSYFLCQLNLKIYAGNSGSLSYEIRPRTITDLGTYTGTSINSEYYVTSDFIDREGYISLYVYAILDNTFTMDTFIWIINARTGDAISIDNYPYNPATYNNITSLQLLIDELTYQADNIISYPRSTYKYQSDQTIEHKLKIESIDFNTQITINAPKSWTYSFINPIVTTSVSNSDLIITNTVDTMYEVAFFSSSTNLVAINDVSSDYMQSPSFESGSLGDDWTNRDSPRNFESVSVDTSIVYDGSFSLKISETDTSYSHGLLKRIDEGEYYISFSYYVESYTSGTFAFQYYDGTTFVTVNLDSTITDRWINYFGYMHIKGSTTIDTTDTNFIIAGGVWSVYFDNFFFGKPSGQQSNLGLSEYEFSSQFIYWDGYKNPAATNIDVEWSLRDRTADTEIISKSLTTDTLGYVSYTYRGNLEMKEYENRWWSWDTFWGTTSIDYTESITDWTCFDVTCVIALNSDDKVSGKTSLTFSLTNTPSSGLLDPYVDGVSENIENWDYYVGWQKATVSLTFRNAYYPYFIANTPLYSGWYEDRSIFPLGSSISTDWEFFALDRTNFDRMDVGLDFSEVDRIYPAELDYPVSTTVTYFIDELKFIQAQKSYFTPIPAGYNVYSYETKQDGSKNYDDFSEGVHESWNDYSVPTVQDGYIHYEATTLKARKSSNINIDTNYYNYFAIRYKTNGSSTDWYFTVIVDNIARTEVSFDLIDDESWNLMIFQFTNSAFLGSLTYMSIRHETGAPVYIDIDQIFFINKDTGYDQGYNWEFEEPNYDEGFSTADLVVNGYAEKVSSGYNGFNLDASIDTILGNPVVPDFDLMVVRVWADISATFRLQWNLLSGADIVTFNTVANTWIVASRELTSIVGESLDTAGSIIQIIGNNAPAFTFRLDYIRLMKNTEFNGLQESDTYFTFRSENDTLSYYYELDNQSGIVKDNELIFKNNSVGFHTLTYSPIYSNDPAESRYDFLQLASTFYYYQYSVVNEFQVQIQDFSLSDYYVQTYVVSSKDYTYVVKENGTTIASGSGLKDGTSIQTVRDITTGILVNYVIEFTNSLDTIIFTTSYSNAASVSGPSLSIEDISYNIDAGSGYVYFYIATNWANQTVRVKDNSTWLGSTVSEGNSIWSFTPNPGLHNFTAVIYNGVSESFQLSFSVTISPPDVGASNQLLVADYSIDVAAGIFYVTIETSWGNQTVRVKDNSTWLGISVSEGSSSWNFITDVGLHVFTIEVYNSGVWRTLTTSITIAPASVIDFELQYTDFSYDAPAGKIYFSWFTNWGNTTATIKNNSTVLGSGPEESVSVSFINDYGLHNIEILINNSGSILMTLYTSFTIARSQGIYEVYIDIYDGVGLGIDFEKVAVYATVGSTLERIGKSFFWPNNTIYLTVKDYFKVELATDNYNLTSGMINYIGIQVPMFEITLSNPYDVAVAVHIVRATNTMNIIVPSNASFTMTLSTGFYLFALRPIYDDPRFTDNIVGNEPVVQYAPVQDAYEHSQISNYKIRLENRFSSKPLEDSIVEKLRNSKTLQIILFLTALASSGWFVSQRWKNRKKEWK